MSKRVSPSQGADAQEHPFFAMEHATAAQPTTPATDLCDSAEQHVGH